ncbi:unnamed protein product [Effrenium voratum]|uniref:F-box protein n=1 Tax=Effrenium voratum TaxID=2562239 RepID=A0AA36ILG3_9DINO|nr:unnamed protein product [Effrenium voratum]CAJ1412499.1 unnamed protein product [Effrenium voratum]
MAGRAGLHEVLGWLSQRVSQTLCDLKDVHGITAKNYAKMSGVPLPIPAPIPVRSTRSPSPQSQSKGGGSTRNSPQSGMRSGSLRSGSASRKDRTSAHAFDFFEVASSPAPTSPPRRQDAVAPESVSLPGQLPCHSTLVGGTPPPPPTEAESMYAAFDSLERLQKLRSRSPTCDANTVALAAAAAVASAAVSTAAELTPGSLTEGAERIEPKSTEGSDIAPEQSMQARIPQIVRRSLTETFEDVHAATEAAAQGNDLSEMGIYDESPEAGRLYRLSSLPACALGAVAPASRRLRQVAESHAVWSLLCEGLWRRRAVLRRFTALRAEGRGREAYRQSLADSQRTKITKGELVSITWSFRFKAAAGESWQLSDPWWRGGQATRVRFRKDGGAAFKRGPLFGRGPRLRWRLVRLPQSSLQALALVNTEGDNDFTEFGERGVRASVMGREVPTYCVRRNKHNWGWSMESCWVVWSSWPMPERDSPEAALLAEENLPVTFDLQEAQAVAFNIGQHPEEQEEEEDEDEGSEQDEVVPPEEWQVDDMDEVEEAESDEDLDARSDGPTLYTVVRIDDHLVRLPRVLVENTPQDDLLAMMLRRSLDLLPEG